MEALEYFSSVEFRLPPTNNIAMLIGVVCLAATLAATAKADDPPWQDPYSYWNQDSLNTYQKPANDRIFFNQAFFSRHLHRLCP